MDDNPQLTTAQKALTSLTREQRAVLSTTIEGFISCLVPASTSPHEKSYTDIVIQDQAWEQRASWSNDEWNAWETWGWYRHFCRAVRYSSFALFTNQVTNGGLPL